MNIKSIPHPIISEIDTVIIGGGIVGSCLAAFLAEDGDRVACVDDGHHSGSTANAGSLHVQMQSRNIRLSPQLLPDLERALPLYPKAVATWKELDSRLETNIDLKVSGGLMVAETEEQYEFLRKKCERELALGLDVEMLDRAEIERIAPYLGKSIVGAEMCANEGKVNPLLANAAIKQMGMLAGVRFLNGLRIEQIFFKDQDILLSTKNGVIRTGRIAIAAGSGGGHLAQQIGIHIPTIPEPLHMNITEPTIDLIPHLVQHAERSITMKQLGTGNVVIGGGWPAKFDGPKDHPTVRMSSLLGNLRLAGHIAPIINTLALIRTWAGVNSITDGRSVLGMAETNDQVYFALPGDAGYTLGPLCAKLVMEVMQNRRPSFALDDYSHTRFSGDYQRMNLEIN